MSGVCSRVKSAATLDFHLFSDEAHLHLDGFVNKQNARFWTFENPHTVMEMSLHSAKCTVWCTISEQGLIWQIFVKSIRSFREQGMW
jgi:hypothetical protein